ncbi:MAG TPA: hypothetical protein PK965_09670 [Anaerohalosphaeraceae bacterium]|nr:hypothetical protein [Anaerohalosphaeraceae bacterium]
MFSTSCRETEGPALTIDCPSCGERGPADSAEIVEKGTLFFFIPSFRVRTTRLTCRNCGRSFSLNLPLKEVSQLTPADLHQMLWKTPSSLLPTVLALIALAASIIPFAGLLFALITQPFIWKTPSWQRIVSLFAVIISFFSTFFYLAFRL